ncbi:substrate-binding periplasmic protein [Massilia antarctica]|uniref:substrate-binding periplasmic protein n=1 Tax=Massilia antarctica TaxID=2765360 RepID=UPI0006BB7133|nr:transporter substrate-binding domain-containing protein [Massilia sp. H27-R4]MCY0913832.1 transporter substrate-binding domain-containing protein [Massilia sp. H27-R4]CUI04440.1 ABC-type amino acid transport/signal transduction systems, periplasmic component/domain [Janthinobacterium sp. CG23_2]CUU28226.1 ABC-type amino acid transport/signal transduction systems, periplasmic component/domain [Janthinobacterium sp. CG23_2]
MRLKYLLLLPALALRFAQGAETVQLATYYDYVPWFVPGQPSAGLNARLASKLNSLAGGRYRFESVYIPRRRLDVLLQNEKITLVVPWVHPRFFDDPGRTRYLWTGALMDDESLVVSSRAAPLEYDGPDSLRGKRFGAPSGHRFPDLEPLIAAGDLTRVDVPQIKNALQMLVSNRRLDFTIVDRSALEALRNDPFMDAALLHVASRPRTASYERSMLVPLDKPELYRFLQGALEALRRDRTWLAPHPRVTDKHTPATAGK